MHDFVPDIILRTLRTYGNKASEEAAISRLYGGIHYMMAIDNGVDQGELVGNHIVSKISTRVN